MVECFDGKSEKCIKIMIIEANQKGGKEGKVKAERTQK